MMQERNITDWIDGILYEVAFWNNVYRWDRTWRGMMAWSHYNDIISLECFDANEYLSSISAPIVLDVGCGMSYATGNYLQTGTGKQPLDLHWIDPLSDYFNQIKKRHHRELPDIEFGMLEYLSAFYPAQSVSMVIVQNALDHSANPMKGIVEAIDTLNVGGILYLNHHPDEAETEKYKGFHQYNIRREGESLVIWNRQESVNVNKAIADFATTEVHTHESGHIIAIIRKTAPVPDKLITDKADKSALCHLLLKHARSNVSMSSRLRYYVYNATQFFVQSLSWETKMKLKRLIHQA